MQNVQERFSQIYATDFWVSGSGTGSRPENNVEYMALLARFMALNEVRSVVDLGCGDWQFSRYVDWSKVHYTGIDVVPEVIQGNTQAFARPGLTFKCTTDIDESPPADLLVCKDMMQHLPNDLVETYLRVLPTRFKLLLITNDDFPEDNLNGDIQAGGWRGLRLDQPPFDQDCVTLLSWTVISEIVPVRKRTVLIRGQGKGA